MKRIVLGVAALAAAAVTAAPATANPVWIDTCYATVQMPCGVCYDVKPVGTDCLALR